jgi:MFS family permease
MSDNKPAAAGTEQQFSPGYANYVLGVLFLVYVFNFIDRQVMSVFIAPIKAEFGASDTEMGLLVGFAFAVLYTFAGIPIARLADRANRRNIIAIGLAVWSGMTLASGLAKSFVQLAIARVGVGLGEAAGTPPAHSLIADYFPPERRGMALAVYSSGVFAGSAIAYLGGGYLLEHFDWRTAFIILGVPGLLVALLLRFTVREPQRGQSEGAAGQTETSTLMETLQFLMKSPSWVALMVGCAFLSIPGYGVLMWGYEFLGRVHGLSPVETGKWMAMIVGGGGLLGTLLGGYITDRAGRENQGRRIVVPAALTLAGLPLSLVFFLSDNLSLALLCFFPYYVLMNAYIPAMYSVNQSLAKLHMRATASAIVLFIINIVGAGAGPFIVGALSDGLAPRFGSESIRYALAAVSLLVVAGCSLLFVCGRKLERDLARVSG